ncbi:uncharacterized protein LOC122502120 [Leptopilina heterotoma]|uniref:uncharacterized protein LOC122502120 n=1 Tax=Leptopilina heterotoma TaxID=63436 RepID=UPI001CA92F6C|nr:uncharacterized protein LOC122502120 [Leptopilina heterotoma]
MTTTKTPVSILNEMMVKKRIIPAFDLLGTESINLTTRFTYQVSCDGLIATGSARTKKEAKQESAKEMLEKIATRDAQLKEKALKRPLVTEQSRENVVEPKKSRVAPGQNFIGPLIQLCSKKFMELPQYKIDETGPAHMKTFSVTCSVSTLTAYGYGKTKKQARNEAAFKMWEMIQEQISADPQNNDIKKELQSSLIKNSKELPPDNEIVQINSTNGQFANKLKTQDENTIPDSSTVKIDKILEAKNETTSTHDAPLSHENASSSDEKTTNEKTVSDGAVKVHNPLATKIKSSIKENETDSPTSNETEVTTENVKVHNPLSTKLQNPQNSPLLKFMQMKADSNKLLITDGHFKKCFEDEIRQPILQQVVNLMKEINSAQEITEKFFSEVRTNFIELLKPLKLIYKSKKLETKSSKFIMFVEISTNPDINEIGIADTLHQAEIMGIKQILQLLIKML